MKRLVAVVGAGISAAAVLVGCAGDSGGSGATTCREFLVMDDAAQVASVTKMLQDRGVAASRDDVEGKKVFTVGLCQSEDKKKSSISDLNF